MLGDKVAGDKVLGDKVVLDFVKIRARLELLELPTFDWVIGVATGGTVPASLLAYKLGCPLGLIHLNYRAEDNTPRYAAPRLQAPFGRLEARAVLLVDDVSVTGATLSAAKAQLGACAVTTLVMKGHADIVLFPEIASCVRWPWKLS